MVVPEIVAAQKTVVLSLFYGDIDGTCFRRIVGRQLEVADVDGLVHG